MSMDVPPAGGPNQPVPQAGGPNQPPAVGGSTAVDPAWGPPEGLPSPGEHVAEPDGGTRKRLPLWDRIKFLLLLGIVWLLLIWAAMASNPILPFADAVRLQARSSWWLFALLCLEVVRQIHFLISEHWAAYHRFWTRKVFGGVDRAMRRRFSDWTRFRLARILKILLWIAFYAVVAGKILGTSPIVAIFEAPAIVWRVMPFVLQLAFAFFFIAFQFIGLFWLLSRGGVDVYYPDDIKTRFSDVWGQDHVLTRVKENILFLEHPDEIEEKGGYVPGGLLLWGPPGTGKTLMAEAVAGETGKPYVFVDPGAFINMFFGVGILKVKSLFRKLRKLALRYGGVIVFFDEADALGNRGAIGQTGPGGPGRVSPAPFRAAGCHGFSYLSADTQLRLVRSAMSHPDTVEDEAPRTRRSRFVAGAGMGGGGGGQGTLQALLTELSGLKKPRGLVNRYVRRALGMRPKPPPKWPALMSERR